MANWNPIDRLIGSRLRQRRIQLGIDPGSLASTLQISVDHFERLEAGKERINAQLMQKICVALGVNIAFFFNDPAMRHSSTKRDHVARLHH